MRSARQCLWTVTLAAVTTASTLAQRAVQPQAPPPPSTASGSPEVVAGIPVNYDESKVGQYTLPDALTSLNGQPVRDAQRWMEQRRPEIIRLLETEQFGKAPGRPIAERFEVFDPGTPALGGKAIRRQLFIHLTADPTGPKIQVVEYLPAATEKPAPLLLAISFGAVQSTVDDPGIRPESVWDPKTKTRIPANQTRSFGRIDPLPLLDAGIGFATFYYGDVDPDFAAGFGDGIRARYAKAGGTEENRAGEDWGSIAAWAWGLSRVEDYLETDKGVDSHRVAIFGVSRLGKTVMWAGAHDQRFAAVIASCSGEGGAALSHRNYGETIAHLTAPSRYPYQFAANFGKHAGFPDTNPFDANLLVALVAPRPLLLQTGDADHWSDPKGEFLAAVAAGTVYRLLGKPDLGTDVWPGPGQPLWHDGGLNYYMHAGGHGTVPSDWPIFVEFLKRNLHPEH